MVSLFKYNSRRCGAKMADQTLRILLVDQNVTRASILEEGLREAGYANVAVVRDMQNLLRRIVDADPDVIFIDLENRTATCSSRCSRCLAASGGLLPCSWTTPTPI